MISHFFQFIKNNVNIKKQFSVEVINTLNGRLKEINDTYPDINCGGCGVFAYELGSLLIERGIKCKIVWIQRHKNKTLSKEFTQTITNKPNKLTDIDNHIICSHIMLYVDGLYIDSSGVYTKFTQTDWGLLDYKILGYTAVENIKNICKRQKGWNVTFKRKYIAPIKKDLKKLVYDLELTK